jgi:hypothetical protein
MIFFLRVKTFQCEIEEESDKQEEETANATSGQNVAKYSVHGFQINVVRAT